MLSKNFFAYLLCACVCLSGCDASETPVSQTTTKQENTTQPVQDDLKSGENQPRSEKTQTTRRSDIRRVDFNNFTYNAFCGDSPTEGKAIEVTVKNGEYQGDENDPPTYFEVKVDAYGDLTGDGEEEAIVSSLCNTGGTGQFSEGYVYTLKNDKPVLLTTFEGGDRGYGGLQSVKIKDGVLFVERNDGEAACCAEKTLTAKYRLNGSKLVEVGKPVSRKLDSATPIRFEAGKSNKVTELSFDGRETKTFVVEVNAGQTIKVTSDDKNITISPSDLINKQSITEEKVNNGTKFKVSQNGKYGFSIQNLDYDPRKLVFDTEIK